MFVELVYVCYNRLLTHKANIKCISARDYHIARVSLS